jgi:hypothetical protein
MCLIVADIVTQGASMIPPIAIGAAFRVVTALGKAVYNAFQESSMTQEKSDILISDVAHALSRNDPDAGQERMAQFRARLEADVAFAAEVARNAAYSQDRVVNNAASLKTGRVTAPKTLNLITATDRYYTQAMEGDIARVREQRIALYQAELAKGTPPARIYDKIAAFNAQLPDSYKIATGLAA